MRKVYNQKNISLIIDGTTIQDFFEGATVVITKDGGEVDKTQGTDGASINIATNQGQTWKFTLRETSRSRSFLLSINKNQYNGGPGVTAVLRTGSDVLETLTEAYISREGELSTGDKKMGGIQYTLTSAEDDTNNLEVASIF